MNSNLCQCKFMNCVHCTGLMSTLQSVLSYQNEMVLHPIYFVGLDALEMLTNCMSLK